MCRRHISWKPVLETLHLCYLRQCKVVAIFCNAISTFGYLKTLYNSLSLTFDQPLQTGVVRAIACVAGGIGGGVPFCFVRRRSAGAAESLGASQIEIFPRDRYPACNNPASYARYPFNHPISSPPRTNSKPLSYKLNIFSLYSVFKFHVSCFVKCQ